MCGIAGFIHRIVPDNAQAPRANIGAMLHALAHRGPDASGVWSGACRTGQWKITLGHRRLSIVDLEGGAQPMANEDGRRRITFNGEIYNAPVLRPVLEHAGHHFNTHSDTEVIIHHFEQHGLPGLVDLDGMFAFAIWDDERGILTLARDRCGIKPLYWTRLTDGGIAFASELLALATHPDVDRTICKAAFAEYLFRDYVHPPGTMLQNVWKLAPGEFLQWHVNGGSISQGLYWTMPTVDPRRVAHAEELDTLVNESVVSQLMSDVPLGVFLSGGLDSSLVAAFASRAYGRAIDTFSIGFKDRSFDESAYAERVAKHIGANHHVRTINETEMLETLPSVLDCLDEPMADHSIVPTYFLSRMAREHVKVALSGDGGDELFAGYPTYRAHELANHFARIPGWLTDRVLTPTVRALPESQRYLGLRWKLKRFVLRWENDPIQRHQRWMASTDIPVLCDLLPGAPPVQMSDSFADGGVDQLDRLLRFDTRTYLPGSVLAKVDRASMAHGLEVRPPLLGNAILDYAQRLPSAWKRRHGTSKWALKQVARAYLPHDIIDRPKHGFSIPLAKWMRGPLRTCYETALSDDALFAVTGLCKSSTKLLCDDHSSGRTNHSKTLWSLIVFSHWFNRLQTIR